MGITMYGTSWCGDCKRAKQFFGEQRVHYDFVEVDAERARPVNRVQQVRQAARCLQLGCEDSR